ncbi:hypothetical protein [Methylobacter sp.]|uniref:hypothetical protein n=1 Tax=Methylobacter sp. TaxID=2051955 RepID=UPI002FDCE9DE
MKPFPQRSMLHHVLVLPCLLSVAVAQAAVTTTDFTAPTEYCFEQTVLRGELSKTTLEHNLLIAAADYYKNGNVFVGFRRRSQPDALWLLNGNSWSAYDSGNPIDVYPDSYSYQLTTPGVLQPVMHLPIIYVPLDLTAFSGDGEIWVGYGLRNSAEATVKEAYQDMITNQRYSRIWSIGGDAPISVRICLTTTQMRLFGVKGSNFVDFPSSQQ